MKNNFIKIIFVWLLFFGLVQIVFAKTDRLIMIGPRENIATSTPAAYGFWSFSILDKNKISRSGQPLISEFKWLKSNGWKGVVDLRIDGEYKEIGDDQKIKGFKNLGFNYLSLPIKDGGAPTLKQAQQFLKFVIDPKNKPVHVHCRGGYGRTGTMIALYRYAVDGWTMPQAIEESRLYHGGVDSIQKKWLINWVKNKN
ncbi:MAG: tyrosine-protein phosphatase [Candidatus Falkowbacteria bacterium]|nr:tyrosine-protein phosphatase [Candidatus Falkowbacteria bacterium]